MKLKCINNVNNTNKHTKDIHMTKPLSKLLAKSNN